MLSFAQSRAPTQCYYRTLALPTVSPCLLSQQKHCIPLDLCWVENTHRYCHKDEVINKHPQAKTIFINTSDKHTTVSTTLLAKFALHVCQALSIANFSKHFETYTCTCTKICDAIYILSRYTYINTNYHNII